MPNWPGTPTAPQWPGTPAATPQQAIDQRWPGQPSSPSVQRATPVTPPPQDPAAPKTHITVRPSDAGTVAEDDHGYGAEVGRQWQSGLEKIAALAGRGNMGVFEGLGTTLGAVGGAAQAAASPLTGAIRSFGGRGINAAERAMRYPAAKLYGEDRVPKAPTFEQSAGEAERLSMIAPAVGFAPQRGALTGLQAARNAMRTIEKIFSPETVDANARAAASIIREHYGTAARDTATTERQLESGWRTVNAMPAQDQLNLISYVEGRSGQWAGTRLADPAAQDVADKMRTAFEARMAKLQALPAHQQQAFIEDYFPHFWKEPGAAPNVRPAQTTGGAGKQGSGASLRQRTVPTIADGIAAGLTPITTNPLEATMRYINSMDRFIAAEAVMQTAKDQGMVKWVRPKAMGASGHPESFKVPAGYEPLQGRGATNANGAKAYAPEGFARVYNNFISRGFAEIRPELGSAYDAARMTSNAITGMELSLSGYHFMTVVKAALDNSMAQSIQLLRKGMLVQAAKQLAKTPLAPIRYAREGKKVQDVYLGLSPGTRELQNVVDKLERAGGRAIGGRKHSPDYVFSSQGDYVKAFKRGALRMQLAADRAEMGARPIAGTAKVIARHIGRAMDTVAAPLFEKYIPAVKSGAFRENLATWLKSHPNATQDEQLNAARQIWDTIDDRFGEMVQDNIFMNNLIKQIGMLGMRSWSWTVGQDVRMLAGGARDVLRAPFKRVTGTGPQDERFTGKMDMLIAMPIVYGTIAAIYQTLKTGKPPQDVQDLIAPRTGGADAATGEPERLLLPGPEKDVFGFYEHPVDEAMNKRSTMVSQASSLLQNRNWRDDVIFSSDPNAPPWLQQFWDYASESFGPISMRNLAQGKKAGSELNRLEQVLGVRTAPRYLTDPEGYEQMMKGIRGKQWRDKMRHQRRQESYYEGD